MAYRQKLTASSIKKTTLLSLWLCGCGTLFVESVKVTIVSLALFLFFNSETWHLDVDGDGLLTNLDDGNLVMHS